MKGTNFDLIVEIPLVVESTFTKSMNDSMGTNTFDMWRMTIDICSLLAMSDVSSTINPNCWES